jgi:hypothetical protein
MATDRRARLLAAMRALDREITTEDAWHYYRAAGIAPKRATARHDLKTLAKRGALALRDDTAHRSYTPTRQEGTAS